MLTNLPFVSVIVPVFNDPTGIKNCLMALSLQSYPAARFEVIIVDNGSSPPIATPPLLPFRGRVEVCGKSGSYAARNAGAKIASGDILAFTDADCIPCVEWLTAGVAELGKHDNKCIIGGDVHISAPTVRTGVALYQYATGFQQKENIVNKGFTATANLFCTERQFAVVGPFDERLLSGGDRDWSWRAAQAGFGLAFAQLAFVDTAPRISLRSAIRQTRRTTAGRKHLRQHGLNIQGNNALSPHRSIGESVAWILKNTDLSSRERLKVLAVASILKGVSWLENLRLSLGGKAERR
jgi:glycosyltransferase involved in cell wall biosynthesis